MPKPTHADAQLLLHLYEMRREPELRRARKWLMSEFKATTWADIKSRYLSNVDEDRWYRMTTSYWEMLASLVNRGALHAELFFDHTGEDIVTWERIKTLIPDARADIRPNYLWQLEKLVTDHQAYRKKSIAAFQAAAKPTPSGANGSAGRAAALAARAKRGAAALAERAKRGGAELSERAKRGGAELTERAKRSGTELTERAKRGAAELSERAKRARRR
jgi:hypothetical protein